MCFPVGVEPTRGSYPHQPLGLEHFPFRHGDTSSVSPCHRLPCVQEYIFSGGIRFPQSVSGTSQEKRVSVPPRRYTICYSLLYKRVSLLGKWSRQGSNLPCQFQVVTLLMACYRYITEPLFSGVSRPTVITLLDFYLYVNF